MYVVIYALEERARTEGDAMRRSIKVVESRAKLSVARFIMKSLSESNNITATCVLIKKRYFYGMFVEEY
jgi:hypothetical protein